LSFRAQRITPCHFERSRRAFFKKHGGAVEKSPTRIDSIPHLSFHTGPKSVFVILNAAKQSEESHFIIRYSLFDIRYSLPVNRQS
jgi:hypothetical protein